MRHDTTSGSGSDLLLQAPMRNLTIRDDKSVGSISSTFTAERYRGGKRSIPPQHEQEGVSEIAEETVYADEHDDEDSEIFSAITGSAATTASIAEEESSTLYKIPSSLKRSDSSPRNYRSPAHRVRIDEDLNEEFWSPSHWEDLYYLWYHEQDYYAFRTDIVKEVRRLSKTSKYSHVLTKLYQACLIAQEDQGVMLEQLLECSDVRQLKKIFAMPAWSPDCVLGIERLVSKVILDDRNERKHLHAEVVEDMQAFGWESIEVEESRIHDASVVISLSSRLFARHLALAIEPEFPCS